MPKNINMIHESVFETVDIVILEETSLGIDNLKKIRFRAKLQEKDVINNNRRRYSDAALVVIADQLSPKASERKLLGELDHPNPQGDDKAKLKRSSTISLKEACILYTSIKYDGRYILGECETITSGCGPDLYNYIKDRVVIGFSLRAFGSTTTTPEGIIEVDPVGLKALTFDVVSNPSHSNAVIYEILNENSQPVDSFELVKMLEESKQELTALDIIEENGMMSFKDNNSTNTLLEESTICACEGDACLNGTIEESIDFMRHQASMNLGNNLLPNKKISLYK